MFVVSTCTSMATLHATHKVGAPRNSPLAIPRPFSQPQNVQMTNHHTLNTNTQPQQPRQKLLAGCELVSVEGPHVLEATHHLDDLRAEHVCTRMAQAVFYVATQPRPGERRLEAASGAPPKLQPL